MGSLSVNSLENLTSLDLESNHFKSILNISTLTSLNKLKILALNFNSISEISSNETALTFSRELKRVELAFNEIGDWDFVNQLPTLFPGLENLRISHNPLYDEKSGFRSADDGYLLTIARIAHLKILNYSPVLFISLSL
jgi:tubulin-specific chaperone E